MTRLTPLGRRPEVEALEDRLVPATNALANLNFMARVELDLLHHPLDGLGVALARRLDHGASRAAVIRAFEGTGAFQAALVDDAFVQILGHGPDAGELTGGLRFLRHGGRVLDLEVRLAATDEFFLANGATVDGFLAGLYRVGAGRLPSPAEQVSGDAALTRGENRLTVARGVLEGPAGLAFQADTVFVTLLRHHAEGGELGQGIFLVSRRGLEGLIASVLRSGEYYHLSNVHATHLIFLGQPGTQTAGVAFAAAAAAVDDAGQLDVTFNGPVTVGLGANPAGGSLQGTPTETATAGVVVFGPLSISKAGGGYTLAVSTPGLRGAATGPFTVSPASADHLVFTEQPQNTTAGQAFTVQVTAEDQFGNVDTNDNNAVALAIGTNPGKDTLHGGPTTVTADHGVATFTNLSIDKSGSGYTLVATSGGVPAVTSAAFNVRAAAATQLVFTTPPPGDVQAGQVFDVKVSAEDQFGNVDTNYVGRVTVSLATKPAGGALGGTTTQPVQGGVADFPDLSANKEGQYTLAASSGTLQPPTPAPFNVSAGAATQLVFTGNVPTTPADSTLSGVTLLAEDANGNQDPNFNGPVTVSLSGGTAGADLNGTKQVNAQGGSVTFSDLSVSKAGAGYVLTFTSNGLTSAMSNRFNITGPQITSITGTPFNNPPAQVVGGTFDINGSNLLGQGTPTVTINGTNAPVDLANSTASKLVVTVPFTQTGTLTVTTSAGSTSVDTSGNRLTFVPLLRDTDGDFRVLDPTYGPSGFETVSEHTNDPDPVDGGTTTD